MSENAGKQFVGIDLHRRRSVIVRSTPEGDVLEAVQIVNDVDRLNSALDRPRPFRDDLRKRGGRYRV